jgi:hypothetical protein
VRSAVTGERDMRIAAREWCVIELNRRNPAGNTVYVSRIQVRGVKGRGEEEDEAIIAMHEVLLDHRHGARSPSRFSSTKHDPLPR